MNVSTVSASGRPPAEASQLRAFLLLLAVTSGLVTVESLALPELFASPAYRTLRPHLGIFGAVSLAAVVGAAVLASGRRTRLGIAGGLLLAGLPAFMLAVAFLSTGAPIGAWGWGVLATISMGLGAALLTGRTPRWHPVPLAVGLVLAGNGATMLAIPGFFSRALYGDLVDALLPFGVLLLPAGAGVVAGEVLGRRGLALAATALAGIGLGGLVDAFVRNGLWVGVALYWVLALFLVVVLLGGFTLRRTATVQLALLAGLGTWLLASHLRGQPATGSDALSVHAAIVALVGAWLLAELRPKLMWPARALAAVVLALSAADTLGQWGTSGGTGEIASRVILPIDTGVVLLVLAAALLARTWWPDAGVVLVAVTAAFTATITVAAVHLLVTVLTADAHSLSFTLDIEQDQAFLLFGTASSLGLLAWRRGVSGPIQPRIYAAVASILVIVLLRTLVAARALQALAAPGEALDPAILAVANRVLVLLSVPLVLALVGMAVIISGQIMRPLDRMVDVVRRRAAGDRTARTDLRQADEFGVLGSALDVAFAAQDEANAQTDAERARIQLILDNAPIMLYALDQDGVFTLSEGSGLATLGLRPGQVVGQSAFDLFADVPTSLEPIRRALGGLAARTTVVGRGWVFDSTHYPVRDAGGRVSGVVGVALDVTAREGAQARLLLLESAVEHGTDAIVITEAGAEDPVIQYLNPAFGRLTGLSTAELVGRPFSSVRSVIVPDAARSSLARAAVGRREAFDSEVEIHRADGSTVIADVRFAPILDSAGAAVSLVSRWRDITGRRRAERMLERRAAHLSSVIERSLDAIVAVEEAGLIVGWNPEAEALFGWSRADVLGLQAADLIIPPILREGRGVGFQPYLVANPTRGGLIERARITADALDRHGRVFPVEIVASQHEADDGSAIMTAFFRDVSERERQEAALQRLALYDPLTDLPNRTLVADRWQLAAAAARREGTRIGLALLDLDQFKAVNDALGHAVGDQLLIEVGRRLRAAVRGTDTVGRLGGDEFVAVLTELRSQADAVAAARALLASLEHSFEIDGRSLAIAASAGVAFRELREESFTEALREADIAMYQAKRAGGDGVAAYVPSAESETATRITLGADLRAAIESDGLRLAYQPVIDAGSGEALEVEALARWDHPQLGPIPPEEFVAVAERSGLVNSFGSWVLERALDDLGRWRAAGLDLGVHVNVSVRQLGDGSFVDAALDALRRRDVPPAALTVELTESLLVHDFPRIREDLVRLRSGGVRVSLDDFGTGYSSIGYLQQLPLDEIKLDKSTTIGAVDDPRRIALVRAARELARSLGLAFVAEGVEDERTWDLLASLGDARAQGFGIGRPMPAEALADWIVTHRRRVDARLAAQRAAAVGQSLRAAERLRQGSGSTLSLDDLLTNLWHELRDPVPYDRIGVALLEEDGRILRARWAKASYGEALRISRGYSAPMAGSSLGEILRTGKPRIIGDLVAYLAQKPDSLSTRLLVGEGVRSSLTCPLIVGGAAVGFMFFSSREPHTYNDAHVLAFQSLAALVSGSVARALEPPRLFTET